MQNSIIDKAKKLGLDTGSGDLDDNLRTIASQVGLHDFNSKTDLETLNGILDERLNIDDKLDDVEDANIGEDVQNAQIRDEAFGQKEYDGAKKNGVYNADYYKNRQQDLDKKADELNQERQKNWKMKKGETGPVKADGSNTVRKSKMDMVMDNLKYANAKKNAITNKIDDAKAKAYNVTHPGEAIKDKAEAKVKDVAKDTGKKAASAVGNAGKKAASKTAKVTAKAGAKLVTFIAANPWVLLVLIVFLLIFLILLVVIGDSSSGSGYYSQECDINISSVELKSCDSDEIENITIEDYVYGVTNSLLNNNDYSDDTIKAVMVVVKTNLLAYGNYSNKKISIDDCDVNYEKVSDEVKKKYSGLYTSIEDYLYIPSDLGKSATEMDKANVLNIDNDILNELNEFDGTYSDKLNNVYSNSSIISYFVGANHIQQLVNYNFVKEENAFTCSECGYNWLVGDGQSEIIDSLKTKNTNGNIIFMIGEYDYKEVTANSYFAKFNELAETLTSNDIYIVSLGPVDDSKSKYAKNESINNFNNEMETLIKNANKSNLKFINLNEKINKFDDNGVLYSEEDYKNLFSKISSKVNLNVQSLELYSITSHCKSQIITGNTAYWWPIGSENPTNGKIYGGTPSSTTISSEFGPRVLGNTSGNHGAIDISVGGRSNQDVVVATLDGTVIDVNDTCTNNGSLENRCGGGFGNRVFIDHGNGIVTKYAHMYPGSIVVKVGDKVVQGQKLGMVGTSGNSTGPHLHFQVELNGVKVNPLDYVNPNNPRPVSITIGSVNTSVNGSGATDVCNALKSAGFSTNAIAGIMVNMEHESHFNPAAVEGSSGYTLSNIERVPGTVAAGFGLIQWSYGRRLNVIKYAKSQGQPITSLNAQLNYFIQELNTGYETTRKAIYSNASAASIATTFCLDFERPKNKETRCPARARASAEKYVNFVKNGCQ